MHIDKRYKGILFMLLAALGFSVMGGAAKSLKGSFGAGQLVFYRNLIGLMVLVPGLFIKPPVQPGGKFLRLAFRGIMGTIALYTLLYCILHIPLGTAMSYNLTSALFIAIFSFFLFGEYHGKKVLFAVLIGFAGMLLIYKPIMHFPWYYHLTGLISGIVSAIAYLTLGRL
ncbi:MAG TPA: DMT family transporter, partial [Chitinophagaceae bacterium]|nr:DMT family transporter [Chitinophagaceae bacterium]